MNRMPLREFLNLMREFRIVECDAELCDSMGQRTGFYKFKVHPSAFPAPGETPLPSGPPIGELNGGPPTDDEMLFASSPYPLTKDELNAAPPGKG